MSARMSALGRTRTCGQPLRRRLLYPLSYEGGALTLAELPRPSDYRFFIATKGTSHRVTAD